VLPFPSSLIWYHRARVSSLSLLTSAPPAATPLPAASVPAVPDFQIRSPSSLPLVRELRSPCHARWPPSPRAATLARLSSAPFQLLYMTRFLLFSMCPQRINLQTYLPRPIPELIIIFFFPNSMWLIHLEFEGGRGLEIYRFSYFSFCIGFYL
jgi:hypothetical protein